MLLMDNVNRCGLALLMFETKATSSGKQRIHPLELGISLYRFNARLRRHTIPWRQVARQQAGTRSLLGVYYLSFLYQVKAREVTKIKYKKYCTFSACSLSPKVH